MDEKYWGKIRVRNIDLLDMCIWELGYVLVVYEIVISQQLMGGESKVLDRILEIVNFEQVEILMLVRFRKMRDIGEVRDQRLVESVYILEREKFCEKDRSVNSRDF